MMLGQNEDADQLKIVQQKYGFDQPIFTQYLYYLNDLSPLSFHYNNEEHYTHLSSKNYKHILLFKTQNKSFVLKPPYLRTSFTRQGKNVSEILKDTLPNTIILASTSIIIALLLGVLLGIISALYKDHLIDKFILIISTLGMSLPSFFSAIIFAWLFGFLWHEFTGLEMTGNLYELDDYGEYSALQFQNLILPSIVLGIRPLGSFTVDAEFFARSVQSRVYQNGGSQGVECKTSAFKHALKNAMSPVVTAISGWFASLLAGAVFVEYVFGWNGLGKEIVNALNTLDLPVIMGAVLIIATIFVILNIVVDIIYAYLDPKIKLN